MTYTYHYNSPLGGITLSSNGTELTGLWFDGQKYFGVICASTQGDFYYVFMSATTSVNADHFKLSQGTVCPLAGYLL